MAHSYESLMLQRADSPFEYNTDPFRPFFPPQDRSNPEAIGRQTRSGRSRNPIRDPSPRRASPRRNASPRRVTKSDSQAASKSRARNRSPSRARSRAPKTKSSATSLKTPHITQPLSVLTANIGIPLKDIETWVHRPASERQAETATRNGYVTRPMNSFMLYRSAYAERTKQWCLQNNHQIVSSVAGLSWPLEPKEIRELYEEYSRIDRDNHAAAHPDYKFSPSKTGALSKRAKIARGAGRGSDMDISEEENSGDDDDSDVALSDDEYRPRGRRLRGGRTDSPLRGRGRGGAASRMRSVIPANQIITPYAAYDSSLAAGETITAQPFTMPQSWMTTTHDGVGMNKPLPYTASPDVRGDAGFQHYSSYDFDPLPQSRPQQAAMYAHQQFQMGMGTAMQHSQQQQQQMSSYNFGQPAEPYYGNQAPLGLPSGHEQLSGLGLDMYTNENHLQLQSQYPSLDGYQPAQMQVHGQNQNQNHDQIDPMLLGFEEDHQGNGSANGHTQQQEQDWAQPFDQQDWELS